MEPFRNRYNPEPKPNLLPEFFKTPNQNRNLKSHKDSDPQFQVYIF